MMDEKAAWALAGAGLGWALTFGSTVLKEKLRTWRLAKSMLEELKDIRVQVLGVIEAHARNLQLAGAGGMEGSGIPTVHHLFFASAYEEVFPILSQARRLSYQLIHSSVESLNAQNSELDRFFLQETQSKAPADQDIPRAVRIWTEKVQACFVNAHEIVWYVDSHLSHPTGKIVDHYGSDHREWLQNRVAVETRAAALLEEGRHCSRESLEKTFDARSFDAYAQKAGQRVTL